MRGTTYVGSAGVHSAALPLPLTPLVGREGEVAAARHELQRAEVRLLTLLGPPGVGKTRLAQALAARVAGDFPGGVWLVPLAPLAEAALVLPAIARALGLVDAAGTDLPLRERLEARLRGAPRLLVLDNAEHVLPAAGQALLRRLGVFVGGFTLEAAEAVAGGAAGDPGGDVLEGLAALVDTSLVGPPVEGPAGEAGGPGGSVGEARYGLLETVREFALERLGLSGEAEAVRRRHARHYLALVEAAPPAGRLGYGPFERPTLARFEREHDNLRAALRWAQVQGDGEVLLRLAGALYRFWWPRGHVGEGRAWVEAALAKSTGRDAAAAPRLRAARARALNGAGVLARAQGDLSAARGYFEESLTALRQLGDAAGVTNAVQNLGAVATLQGDAGAARPLLEGSLATWRGVGNRYGVETALLFLGFAAVIEGRDDEARRRFEECVVHASALDEKRGWATALGHLAMLAAARGDRVRATDLCRESFPIALAAGDRRLVVDAVDRCACLAAAAEARGGVPVESGTGRGAEASAGASLAGWVALAAGGGRWIGRAIADAAAARSVDQLAETVRRIEQGWGRAFALQADVTDRGAVDRLAPAVERRPEPLDLLVNNGGELAPIGVVWEVGPGAWRRCQEVTLRGPLLCARAVLPGMPTRRGGHLAELVRRAEEPRGEIRRADVNVLWRRDDGVAVPTDRSTPAGAMATCPRPPGASAAVASSPARISTGRRVPSATSVRHLRDRTASTAQPAPGRRQP
jgi:predicted ATPase